MQQVDAAGLGLYWRSYLFGRHLPAFVAGSVTTDQEERRPRVINLGTAKAAEVTTLPADKWVIGAILVVLGIVSAQPIKQWMARRQQQQMQCLDVNTQAEALKATARQGARIHVLLSPESTAQLAVNDCHLFGQNDEALRKAATAIAWAESSR